MFVCHVRKTEEAATQAYLAALRGNMAERRFKDLQAILRNIDVAALRALISWRVTAHYLKANHARESFLLGRNFMALKGLAMQARGCEFLCSK